MKSDWYSRNKEKHKAFMQEWRAKNKERHKQIVKNYYENNKEAVIKRHTKYQKKRYHEDERYRLQIIIKASLRQFLRNTGQTKSDKTNNILGYSSKELFEHIGDEIFVLKMYGIKPHIEHCIPLEWFRNNTPPSISFHLQNLRAASEEENLAKLHYYPTSVSTDYLEMIRSHIKPEYLCW